MDEHSYFRSIEERFIELRGAPLLLSPADYQVAKRWFAEGIPLPVVHGALEGLFARRAERGAAGPVQSLRYCASAVEGAWKRAAELTQADRREKVTPVETGPRLEALAAAVPVHLPGGEGLRSEIAALSGGVEEVERALSALDGRLLSAAAETLDAPARAELRQRVDRSLEALGGRMAEAEREAARDRLFEQALRRRLGLPVLSLFFES